jgi:hypothetical protein
LNRIEENQINCTASKKYSNITIGNILWINNRDFFFLFHLKRTSQRQLCFIWGKILWRANSFLNYIILNFKNVI